MCEESFEVLRETLAQTGELLAELLQKLSHRTLAGLKIRGVTNHHQIRLARRIFWICITGRMIRKARSLAKRLELHYTPKHGSWLNVAEIELSVLARQRLDSRIPDLQTLTNQVEAWKCDRNEKHRTVDWQFTTTDARIKLKKLYPKF